jgi:hypothetical protein
LILLIGMYYRVFIYCCLEHRGYYEVSGDAGFLRGNAAMRGTRMKENPPVF